MSLLKKLKPDELYQVIHDLLFEKNQASRDEIAHFCEHDGICINFTRASSTWRALAPCALKPWWLFLNTLKKEIRKNMHNKHNEKNKITTNAAQDAEKIEVIDNA